MVRYNIYFVLINNAICTTLLQLSLSRLKTPLLAMSGVSRALGCVSNRLQSPKIMQPQYLRPHFTHL